MHKSGKIRLCILAFLLAAVAAASFGCGNKNSHTHTYSSEWAFDAQSHWHPSSCSHDTKANKSGHTYTSTVIPPTVTDSGYTLNVCACGYSYTSNPTASLPADSLQLRYNENGHWKPVLGGGDVTVESHTYTDEIVPPTCLEYGYTKHVCECGYWYASDTVNPTEHRFDDGVWAYDENSHWHPALCCDSKSGIRAHDYTETVTLPSCDESGYTQFICKDCGYSHRGRITPPSHSYAAALSGDEYEHWRAADCAHTGEKADVAEHTLIGNSNVCEVCRKQVTPRLAYELSANGEYYSVAGIGCLNASAVVIPDSYRGKPVKEVAARAFKNADVTSVAFGANIEKIGAEAFAYTHLTAADMPDSLLEIGTRAFIGTNIASLDLGGNIAKIGNAAFSGCTMLKTVTAGSINALPPYVFEGCSALQSVTAASVAKVGAQAFYGCAELVTFDLSGCTEIGFSAFCGCEKFVPQIGANLSAAEEYAFSGCAAEHITLPQSLTKISDSLFKGCTRLISAQFTACEVGKSAFEDCTALNSVKADGVRYIGGSAFKGCSSLNSLNLPESVISVGANAFTGTGLITEESGVRYAANVVIGAVGSAGSINIKASAAGIADEAFKDNANVSSVALGGVRFIGENAFKKCSKLTQIEFTAAVKYINANAFRESGLTSVNVPSTVLSIGDSAFYDCKSLASAVIGAKEIGRFAFSYTGVNRTLNSPVKSRPDYAKLTSVTLGSGVTSIGSNAFQYCPISSVALPSGLTYIGKYAFAQTDISSVTIPSAVNRIGEYAFYESKLTSVTFENAAGWRAGKTELSLSSDSQNANLIKNVYKDIDWVRG